MEETRLYRSYRDSMIGGVCGGLGEYLNTDSLIFRVLFAVAVLVGGSGILAYIILWIVIPLEEIPKISSTNNKNMEDNKNSEMKTDAMEDQKKQQQRNDGNLWGGFILIALGSIFLIDRFVPHLGWGDLWPLLLIVIGVILISKNYQKPKN